MITFTDAAHDKILETLQAKGQDGFAVRIRITGRDTDEFIYDFRSVEMATRREDDLVLDMGGFNLLVDPESAEHLHGAVIDFAGPRGGFKIDNPNPVWTNDVARQVAEVISTQINPAVAAHSGRITLVDVRDNKAYIRRAVVRAAGWPGSPSRRASSGRYAGRCLRSRRSWMSRGTRRASGPSTSAARLARRPSLAECPGSGPESGPNRERAQPDL